MSITPNRVASDISCCIDCHLQRVSITVNQRGICRRCRSGSAKRFIVLTYSTLSEEKVLVCTSDNEIEINTVVTKLTEQARGFSVVVWDDQFGCYRGV